MFFWISTFFAASLEAKSWSFPIDSTGKSQVDLDLDLYYSALGYLVSVTDESVPEIDPSQEEGVYSHLFYEMLSPQFVLVEASVNPFPLTGALIRDHASSVYQGASLGEHFNVITALTTGFPEPWALSFFLGNVVHLVRADTTRQITGKGFGGALLSVGNTHIVNSHMVPDYWAEGELKLKGSDIRASRRMSWSFRIGGKIHTHHDIYNILYFSIKRDRVDLKERLHWDLWHLIIRNSEIEVRADTRIPQKIQVWESLSRVFVLAGKKWPSESGKWAFSLSLGLQLQLNNGYRGDLAAELPDRLWSVVIRPNIVF